MSSKELPTLCVHDIVCLKARNNNVGMVRKVSWLADSDDEHWEYFDGLSDDEQDYELKDDHVLVQWNNSLVLSEVHIDKIKVIDRGLTHGDVVSALSDPNGQLGVVIDVILTVDLMMKKTGQRIPGVFPKYVSDIHPFMLGRHTTVKQPPKIVGTIDDVLCDVEVKFQDGSKCIVRNATPDVLRVKEDDISSDEEEPERNYLYYPSQTVTATEAVWNAADWVIKPKNKKPDQKKKKKKAQIPGTVTKVTPATILVSWLRPSSEGENLAEPTPPDNLIVLNYFKHTKFEVGDYAMINPNIKQYFLNIAKSNAPPQTNEPKKGKKKGKGGKTQQKQEENEEEEQTPKQEEKSFNPSITVPEHDQLMEHLNGWSGTEDDVAWVTCTHTHVRVQWQDGSKTDWMNSIDLIPRRHLLDCDFWPGNFVVKDRKNISSDDTGVILSVNYSDRTTRVEWGNSKLEEVPIYGIVKHPERKFKLGGVCLSLKNKEIGEVLQLDGRHVRVAWSNSSEETVEKFDDLKAIDTSDEEEVDLEEEEVQQSQDERNRVLALLDADDEDNQEKSPTTAEKSTEKTTTSAPTESSITTATTTTTSTTTTESTIPTPTITPTESTKTTDSTTSITTADGSTVTISGVPSTSTETVSAFTILEDTVTDHHFLEMTEVHPKLGRVTTKEWKKLQEGLPHGIYVVTYTSRMDLLKALICGPEETIFYCSYYVFDVRFAKDHPFSPPKVSYRSVGYRVHPNLYDDGTVCLSLLGTWSGDQSERWHHARSNMLQLFVSLQGLVLGSKEPYFLEAGYDKLRGTTQGTINSLTFNEMSLINSLKNTLYYLRRPPPEFQKVIQSRAKKDCEEVLSLINACQELIEKQEREKDANLPEKSGNSILKKFCLHDNPSKGFLQLITTTIKEQFQKIYKEM